MGMQHQRPAEAAAPTIDEMMSMERVAVLEMMPARFAEARRELGERPHYMNRFYGHMLTFYEMHNRSLIAQERRQLQSARIYVKPARAERGMIVVRYTCRGVAGNFSFHAEGAARRVRELIAEYEEHARQTFKMP